MTIVTNKRTRAIWIGGVLVIGVIGLAGILFVFSARPRPAGPCLAIDRLPAIRPDYRGVTLPPNVAPLNFVVEEEAVACFVRIHADHGKAIEVFPRDGKVTIPAHPWRRLLDANRGGAIRIDVFTKADTSEVTTGPTSSWQQFKTIENTVAAEEIDDYLVYRRIRPSQVTWRTMGIYQRNLTGFREQVVLDNERFGDGCVNCHAFCNHRTDKMLLGIRSTTYGTPEILIEEDRARQIKTKFGYTSWHPSGQLAAFSVNKVRQTFHAAGREIRDVFDFDSFIACYHVKANEVETAAPLSAKDRLETYPAWAPDGEYLYFCSAPLTWKSQETLPEHHDRIRYDLMRVRYDLAGNTWGEVETVLAAKETGRSALLPRISPDGRWLVLTMCDYGCFPVFRESSDLYLVDLEAAKRTGRYECRRLEINSDASESWHSFSSNGRWLAFSSKRLSHVFTRTFFAYIGADGRVHKPFVLPQKNPLHYDSFLWTFSVPELVKEPVQVNRRTLAQAIRNPGAEPVRMPITMATPKADSGHPDAEPLRE